MVVKSEYQKFSLVDHMIVGVGVHSINFQVLTHLHTFQFHVKTRLFNIKIMLFINQSNDLGQFITPTFKM